MELQSGKTNILIQQLQYLIINITLTRPGIPPPVGWHPEPIRQSALGAGAAIASKGNWQ